MMQKSVSPIIIVVVALGAAGLLVLGGYLLFPVVNATPVGETTAATLLPTMLADATPPATLMALPVPTLPTVNVPPTLGQPASSKIEIIEEHTPEGMYLTLLGPGLPLDYRLGPLARGAYAMGPNDRFLIYVTNSGFVYGLRMGRPHFMRIQNLKRTLVAHRRDDEPLLRLSFEQAEYMTVLIVREDRYSQTIPVLLPRILTN